MKKLLELAAERILILDGAMGTALQGFDLPEEAFQGKLGCNEFLSISAPEQVSAVHEAYLAAGADIIETNTFGANPLVLREYDLEARTEELNRASADLASRAAAKFSTPQNPRFVGGSIGPGTKLASLGQITYDELYKGYKRQVVGLIEGGVNLLIIETCQDLLQIKAALNAARDIISPSDRLSIYVSLTIEQTGSMLTGSDIYAAVAALLPFEIDILGLNCATGPAAMRAHLEALAGCWPGFIGLYPNAGLPIATNEGVTYPEGAEEFAGAIARFAAELPINFAGGCCGTTPAHIAKLSELLSSLKPIKSAARLKPSISSLFNAVEIEQAPPPFFFGERANATGSKAFREALLAKDYEKAFSILVGQEEGGSHGADLSVAYAGLDELQDMDIMASRAAKECRLPLMIDSNSAKAVEIALKRYPGRAVINSINLEDGGERAEQVISLAKRFGAALVCLTIDEQGMATTAQRKLEIAKRLVSLCVEKRGLKPEDLFIDPLTFTVGSGDPSLKGAAAETLKAVEAIKREIKGVHCLLGLSNVSFGLSMKGRKALNSTFLAEAIKAGVDAAILNPMHIIPLSELDESDKRVSMNLIYNNFEGDKDPLEAFINHFAVRADFEEEKSAAKLTVRETLFESIVKGKTEGLDKLASEIIKEISAEETLNDVLIPAMKRVGELFGAGKLQLPFVLKSAAAMKRAVDLLKPHFRAGEGAGKPKKLLIATVRGDVHDIGKNLVNIILSNNGFEVVDLGVKVPVDVIMSEARKAKADAVGMSGLLVSSAMIMAENLRAMSEAGFELPVLVGGAALTPAFTRETLKPAYKCGKVFYCPDAFAGLTAMRAIAQGELSPESPAPTKTALSSDALLPEPMKIVKVTPPEPPFWGRKAIGAMRVDALWSLINQTALFRGRWGYRRGTTRAEEYQKVIEKEVKPKYEELKRIVKVERIFEPKIVKGWFRCKSEGDSLIVFDGESEYCLDFPRRKTEPKISVPDFFRPEGDIVGFFVVTLGDSIEKRGREALEKSEYLDYFLLHGLAAEAADALAEYCHELMRYELGIGEAKRLSSQELIRQKYRGGRFGFGYPACPDLAANEIVFKLLKPEEIGVSLSEIWQMRPEFTTSALVAHHPQAKYFAV